MEGPTTPKHPRVTSIQHDSDLGRTPSQPTSHYSSSTNITEAKANLKSILASRVSFNDPKIVDVLVKPDKVSDQFVQTVNDYISKDKGIMDFLTAVRNQTVQFERDMYKPLCTLLNTITEFIEDDSEDDENNNTGDRSPSKPADDTNFARRINRTWLDVHNLIPRTDPRLFIPGMPTDYHEVEEDNVIGNKRSHTGDDEDDGDTSCPSKARRSSKKRQFARDGNYQGKTDTFEKRRPDLVLVDHSTQEPRRDWCLWRHFAVLLEVKRDRSDGPNPAKGTTLTRLAAQLADMARLHLAARPFMRYSVHFSVCGAIFNLAIFDRAGGVVSKDYNINDDLETFIRIISRLGRHLDAYDLGLDRTVVPLHSLGGWKQFPEFRVTAGGSTYITQGLPLWQSTSLVGRGTFVWVVVLDVDAEESGKGRAKSFILKNAWRACGRLAESTVYKMLYSAREESTMRFTDLDGIAQFVEGGDIFDPQQPNEVIKVSSHRKGFGAPINENDDPVLHRLVLASHGRKLYEFVTFSQLMRAAKKMNSGLRALHERGIIHGDISLGNLFLGTTEDIAGFVGDLDLAKVDLEIIKKIFPAWHTEVASSKRGALRTGTALFMGIPLLEALTKYYKLVDKATKDTAIVVPSELDFVPGPGDDLESMIWVLTYAIMLHHQESLQGSDKADYKRDVVDKFYGSFSYSGLADSRRLMAYDGANPLTSRPEEWIPDTTQCKWFRCAMTLVAGQFMPFFGGGIKAITFDAFDALCDEFLTEE